MSAPPTLADLAHGIADLIDEGSALVGETHSAYISLAGKDRPTVCGCVLGTAAVGALKRLHGNAWPSGLWTITTQDDCVHWIAKALRCEPDDIEDLADDLDNQHTMDGKSRADLAAQLRAPREAA
jgi:hypothetical protein